MMNKQEVIEKIKSEKILGGINNYGLGYNEAIDDAIATVAELDEPEKPIVPRFVADWYEENKDHLEWNLYNFCVNYYERELPDDLHEWFNDFKNKPIQTIVKMKLCGYEVENEKLYTVEIPNPNFCTHVALRKDIHGVVGISIFTRARWRGERSAQLTESEIKKDFEWAWQFAEEVKNDC